MEINIMLDQSGRFIVDKSDDMGVFMAVGMLEMAKKLLLEPDEDVESEPDREVEGQVTLDEVSDEV